MATEFKPNQKILGYLNQIANNSHSINEETIQKYLAIINLSSIDKITDYNLVLSIHDKKLLAWDDERKEKIISFLDNIKDKDKKLLCNEENIEPRHKKKLKNSIVLSQSISALNNIISLKDFLKKNSLETITLKTLNNYESTLKDDIRNNKFDFNKCYVLLMLHYGNSKEFEEIKKEMLTIETKESKLQKSSYSISFNSLPVVEGYKIATNRIKNAKKAIRIIGNLCLNKSIDNKILNDYLEALEEISVNDNKVKYRRISSIDNNELLKNHIEKSIKSTYIIDAQDNKYKTEFLLLSNINLYYSIVIIDDTFLMLVLNSPKKEDGKKYKSYSFILESTGDNKSSTDQVIDMFQHHFINTYQIYRDTGGFRIKEQKHFNAIYKEYMLQYIKNKEGRETDPEIKPLINWIDTLNENAHSHLSKLVVRDNFATEMLLSVFKEFNDRIVGGYNNPTEIRHNIPNSSLIKSLCNLLEHMGEKSSYKTISFERFWSDIIPHNRNDREPDFIKATEKAIEMGSKVQRILVVDRDKLFISENQLINNINNIEALRVNYDIVRYQQNIKHIIESNFELLKYARGVGKQYFFKILFVNTAMHDTLLKDLYNFVLIEAEGIEEKPGKAKPQKYLIFQPSKIDYITDLYFLRTKSAQHQHVLISKEKAWIDTRNRLKNYDSSTLEKITKYFKGEFKQYKLSDAQINKLLTNDNSMA